MICRRVRDRKHTAVARDRRRLRDCLLSVTQLLPAGQREAKASTSLWENVLRWSCRRQQMCSVFLGFFFNLQLRSTKKISLQLQIASLEPCMWPLDGPTLSLGSSELEGWDGWSAALAACCIRLNRLTELWQLTPVNLCLRWLGGLHKHTGRLWHSHPAPATERGLCWPGRARRPQPSGPVKRGSIILKLVSNQGQCR